MSRDKRDEELLQEYLEGDSELSRLYRREAKEQPDARLDARILAEAHRAVSARRRTVHSPFARHWLVPASLAAVLVLSVGVVLLLPDPAPEPGVEQKPALQPGPAPASVGAPAPADSMRLRRQATERVEDKADERAFDAAPHEPVAADQELDEAAGKAREQRRSERKSATGGAAQSLPAAPAAGRIAEEAPSAVLPRPGPMPSDAIRDDPQAWLRFIERLLDEQNRDGATSNLRAFRARYPDYPLPSRLASLEAQRP